MVMGLVDEPNLTQFQDAGCPREVLPAIQDGRYRRYLERRGGSAIGTTVDQNGVVTLGVPGTDVPTVETIRYDDGICFEDVTVTTRDNTPPTVTCPGDREVTVDENCSATVEDYLAGLQFNDDCSRPGAVFVLTQAPAAGPALDAGPNLITLTATDEAGNTGSCTFTITGLDRTAPDVRCPADATVAVDDNCQYIIPDLTDGAELEDNCSDNADLALTQVPAAGQIRSGAGTNVLVSLRARDEAGNQGNCTYTLTLADETPPEITCPATVGDQTVSFTDCTFRLFDYRGQTRRSDNCSPFSQITLSQDPAPGTPVGPGVTTITITAMDAAGNLSSCSFDQAVFDRDPPQLNCPGNPITVPLNADCAAVVPEVTDLPNISDNCGFEDLTITQDPLPGATFTGFFQNVTVRATDLAGNSNICVIGLQPRDDTDPVVTCPAAQVPWSPTPSCRVPPYLTTPAGTATDNCQVVGVRTSNPANIGTEISGAPLPSPWWPAMVTPATKAECTFQVDDRRCKRPPSHHLPRPANHPRRRDLRSPATGLHRPGAATQDNCDGRPRCGVSVTQSARHGRYALRHRPIARSPLPSPLRTRPVTIRSTCTITGYAGRRPAPADHLPRQPPDRRPGRGLSGYRSRLPQRDDRTVDV